MKTISKIQFNHVLGIKESFNLEPGNVNLFQGEKGSGKTSILDGIKVAIANKCDRKQVINNQSEEAQLYVELGDIAIDRKLRTQKSDALKVTQDGVVQSAPQSFLNELFESIQFNPIDFYAADEKDQNKMLLSLLEISWDMNTIQEWFGEIPKGVDFDGHILEILDQIQSKEGHYYKSREEIGRQKRAKEAVIADIRSGIPADYKPEIRDIKLSEKYKEISDIETINGYIQKGEELRDNHEANLKAIEDKYLANNTAIENKFKQQASEHQTIIDDGKVYIEKLDKDFAGIDSETEATIDIHKTTMNDAVAKAKAEYENAIALAEKEYKEQVETVKKVAEDKKVEIKTEIQETTKSIEVSEAKLESIQTLMNTEIDSSIKEMNSEKEKAELKLGKAIEYLKTNEFVDVQPLKDEADKIEHLQSFNREYDRIDVIQKEINSLVAIYDGYTEKIEKARYLPGELLETANLPFEGLSVYEGAVLINNLPIGNLSDGEKLDLAIKISEHKAGEIGIILIDGFEKLNPKAQQEFIERCKTTGFQYFITAVTDGELTISTY